MFVNTQALINELDRKGMSKEDYAAALGVNLSTIYRKLKATQSFTVGEMHKTAEILGLNVTEAARIFFAQ